MPKPDRSRPRVPRPSGEKAWEIEAAMTAARQDPDSGHHRVDYRFRHREGHCGFEDLRDLLRRIGPQG